jgi:apolipoprotein N-acyltransferase
MRRARRPRFVPLLCVALSALAFYASTGPNDWWPLAWIAPVPLLLVAGTPGRAWLYGFVAYAVGHLSTWQAYASFVLPPILGILIVLLAAGFGTALAATAWIVPRVGLWPGLFAFPLAVTAVDAFFLYFMLDVAMLSLAYSQAPFPPALQVAALTGPLGIVFLLALFASAVATALAARRRRRGALVALASVVALEGLVLGLGYLRMTVHLPAAAGQIVRIGVAASDPDLRFFRTEKREEAMPVVEAYARRVRELAARGAELVVLPEKMVSVAPSYRDDAQATLAAAARDAHVRLVAGINLIGIPVRRNVAWVFAPDGRLELEYEKRLLVPRWEDGYHAGSEPGFVPTEAGLVGVAVCRDVFAPRLMRGYAGAGARILLVPAWDFTTDAAIQARIPVLRAVEGGYPVVRVAQEGMLVVADAAGRVLLSRPSWEERETLAVVDVPLGAGRTPYARFGDVFAALDVFALAILLLVAWRSPRA